MDSFEIITFVQKCHHLKHKFTGVFAADNFPKLKPESFIIVNASESSESGTHWLLLGRRRNNVHFADPLGYPLENYQEDFKRVCRMYSKINEVFKSQPIQHIVNDNDLMRFSEHML